MTSEDLNHWLTTLANFGVIAGIVFLVIEIRQTSTQIEQNTAALSAQTFFQINESSNLAKREVAQNTELAEMLLRGNVDPASLSDVEREQYIQWIRARLAFLEAYWFSHHKGLISDREASGLWGSICSTFTTKGVLWVWREHPGSYTDGFAEDVEGKCFE